MATNTATLGTQQAGRQRVAPRGVRVAVSLLPLVLGFIAWAYSVEQYELSSTGLYGLFGSVSPMFAVGLVLIVGGAILELFRRRLREWAMGAYLVALVVVIHATVPLLSPHVPEYAWVYKHIGVIQTFAANGHVTDANNIYQEWPALFAAVAGMSASSGVSPFDIAVWAPLGFDLLECLVVLACFGTLTRDRRVAFLAVLLFQSIVSWVAQDYLSPEAFAYTLWFGMVLLVLRFLVARPPPDHAPSPGRIARLRLYLLRENNLPRLEPGGVRWAPVVATIVTFFAMVATHQLAPYIALVTLAVFAALNILRPRWLIFVLAAIAILYLMPRYGIISSQYGGLLSSFDVFQNASVKSAAIAGSAAETMTAHAVDAMSALTWVATAAIVLRSWRSPGRVIVPAVLAFAPFVILFGQSYGGEAPNRVFLFSVPWCAFLIAQAIQRLRWRSLRAVVIVATFAIGLTAGLQGLYGPLKVDTFTRSEITASTWLYRHVPRHSTIIVPDENFPGQDVANTNTLNLLGFPLDASRRTRALTNGNLPALNSWIRSLRAPHVFLVTSRGEQIWADYYGSPRAALTLPGSLSRARGWSLFYSNPDVKVYQFGS
jgi:hypothetical protein